jgi:hypothetical protein
VRSEENFYMRFAMIALVVTGTAACGSSIPPPNDEYSAAQADVGRAESGGAPGVPDARLHLQLAHEDLQKSKGFIDSGDNKRAADLISVARVEAQLALSLAKQEQAEAEAGKAQAELAKAKGGQ